MASNTQTTSGPADLRRLASAFPEELPQLSARGGVLIAAWESDRTALGQARDEITRLRASLTLIAEGDLTRRNWNPCAIAAAALQGN